MSRDVIVKSALTANVEPGVHDIGYLPYTWSVVAGQLFDTLLHIVYKYVYDCDGRLSASARRGDS